MNQTKQKRRKSIKVRIMLPVLILGIVAIISNVTAMSNIRKVNENAAEIADHYMRSLTELSAIKEQVQELHNLGLSHVVALDSGSMIHTVDTIKEKENVLKESLMAYEKYLDENDKEFYQEMISQFLAFRQALRQVCAFSANVQQSQANTAANVEVMQEFDAKTDNLKVSVSEITESIHTISLAIDEGVTGVSGTAENMQILVTDMDNINTQMGENKGIATKLKHETEIFKKL